MCIYETGHYLFHYREGSYAAGQIASIASGQETCFRHITACLGLVPKDKLHYYFFDTPEALGRFMEEKFGEYMPMNGCTISENEILAVYSERIKCVGCHEDTHLLSYTLCMPQSVFLLEGLACYVDQLWWGIGNQAWTAYFVRQGICPSILRLFENEYFQSVECPVSYPVAGAFVQYLVTRFGMERFLRFYAAEDPMDAASTVFGSSLEALERDFLQYIGLLHYDRAVFARIEEMLKEN